MSRKVFISFLGTTNYLECRYQKDEVISEPSRFVQEALVKMTCLEWTENDCIFIFCTSKDSIGNKGSKEFNWEDNGQDAATTYIEKEGLCHRLEKLKEKEGLKAQIKQIDIKSGFSEEEVWDIFNTVTKVLSPGDEIYFDITHAFRSIPLFALTLFNYSKFLLGTQLCSIMYGAVEKLGPLYQVKAMPVEQRIAPIIDMTNIARLQEYNQAASELSNFGKTKSIGHAIGTAQDQVIKKLIKAINQLEEYISTINLREIKKGRFIHEFRSNYKCAKKSRLLNTPLQNILDKLDEETRDFIDDDSFRNIEVAINWTIKHDMIMQAFPLAAEYLKYRLADEYKTYQIDVDDKPFREMIGALLGMKDENFSNPTSWTGDLAKNPSIAKLLSEEKQIIMLRDLHLYDPIKNARNSLAHANGDYTYEKLKKLFPDIIRCLEFINPEGYSEYPSSIEIKKSINQ